MITCTSGSARLDNFTPFQNLDALVRAYSASRLELPVRLLRSCPQRNSAAFEDTSLLSSTAGAGAGVHGIYDTARVPARVPLTREEKIERRRLRKLRSLPTFRPLFIYLVTLIQVEFFLLISILCKTF